MSSLFETLLAPIDSETFFRDYFGKKHLHVPGAAERTADIMTLDRLNSLLSMTSIWTPGSMKLYLDQRTIGPSHYCVTTPTVDSSSGQRPDPARVQEWIAKGATVILNDIGALSDGARALTDALQTATGGRSQANLYFSMNQHKAFGAHCDAHEVFAVHCSGEKTWNIYEGRDVNPINHPDFKPSSEERARRAGRIVDQVPMKPGDLLYIPRGRYHDALASENGAIHIAFGVTLPTSLDLMSIVWDAAVQDPKMRVDLRKNMSPQDIGAVLAGMSRVIGEALDSEAAQQAAAATVENWPFKFEGYDLQRLVAGKGTGAAERDVVYVVGRHVKVVDHQGRPHLSDGRSQVEIPGAVAGQVGFIMAQQTVTQAAIQGEFPAMSDAAVSELFQWMRTMQVIA